MKKIFIISLFLLLITNLIPILASAQYIEENTKLSPGDTIEIRFFFTPDLNKIQIIRPDGKIVLQLVGEITAAGKTPSELTKELYKLYSDYFNQLDVAVFVESYSSNYVYVGGEVNTPGNVEMKGKLTALEAIMLAGGIISANASYKKIVVMRQKEGKWIQYNLNLAKIIDGESNEPFYLEPLDIVFIPSRYASP